MHTALQQTDQAAANLSEALIRLDEATKATVLLARKTKIEKRLEVVFRRFFSLQHNAVAKALDGFSEALREAEGDQLVSAVEGAVASVNKEQAPVIQTAVEAVLLEGARDAIKDYSLGISFTLKNPRAVKWAKGYSANLITMLDDTSKAQIRTIIVDGLDRGLSYNAIAKNITQLYADFAQPPLKGGPRHVRTRAQLVAITETANAYQQGNYLAVQQATSKGLKFEKKWLTVGDKRVSKGCATNAANGWIKLEDEHSSAHLHPPRFPGCRCSEQYRRAS